MRGTAIACLLVSLVARKDADAADVRVLALSGSPPFGTVTAEHFQRFDAPPIINNRGEVAFLAGPQADPDQPFPGATSVWLAGTSRVHLLASSGSGASPLGHDNTSFATFFDLVLNDASTVAFEATLDSGGVGTPSETGIWQASREGLQRIAQTSRNAPGVEERSFESFFRRPALAADGSTAFYAVVGSPAATSGLDGGFWSSSNGETSLVASSGTTAMHQEPDVAFAAQTFGSPFADRPVVTSGGRTVFSGFLDGPSISPGNGMGVWTNHPVDGLQEIARAGDAAAGDGRTFVSFPEPPAVNDRGDVTFLAFVREGTADAVSSVEHGDFDISIGIWTARDGLLAPRLRVGDHAPDVEQQATFDDFYRPLTNAQGDLAVLAAMEGPDINDQNAIGIWSDGLDADGQLRLVARGGMPAPGVPQDVVFSSFLEPTLNNAGQVAFMAGLAGPDVSDDDGNVLGLWGQDQSGRLRLVARSGDVLEVAQDDFRQIGAIVFASGSGGQDGWPRGLNDHGQVAFRVRFTDGSSAVLLSQALTVPEPSTNVLVVAAITMLLPLIGRQQRIYFRMPKRSQLATAAHFAILTAIASPSLAGDPDFLYPDLIPFVREDQPYLQNWVIDGDLLRLETVFANVGDGLFQIRVDRESPSGGTIDVFQRVFIGTDNGRDYEDFPANRSVFHPAHGHLHLEDFSEFQLRAVTVGDDGLLGVGDLVANTVKTSFLIHDGLPLPDPQWADAPSYPSFNFGTYQNISVGYGDVYSHSTVGQSIDIAQVEPGPLYWLRQIVDPTNVLRETDETNNSFEILIDLKRPSAARMHAYGPFVQPGDFYPIVTGDLDFDQLVTLSDWSLFREGAGTSLAGLTDPQKYILGDLNLDGRHSPADFLIFRQAYEVDNGAGSAAELGVGVPEPATPTIAIAALLAASLACKVRRASRTPPPLPASLRWSE